MKSRKDIAWLSSIRSFNQVEYYDMKGNHIKTNRKQYLNSNLTFCWGPRVRLAPWD